MTLNARTHTAPQRILGITAAAWGLALSARAATVRPRVAHARRGADTLRQFPLRQFPLPSVRQSSFRIAY
ncbi:hypothetical protein [Diaphorobacter sp.]|uniref:hypothetical protein n=1 Tax=Diaphorobacter sp. TaxID=1934310 RepID=UPI0028A941B7|nr:hypothetical protein [Diaphorobacter sp.]